jgi:hypothetical protein
MIERQSRLQALRTILGQLQEIDTVGSGVLANQIAYFLAHPNSFLDTLLLLNSSYQGLLRAASSAFN